MVNHGSYSLSLTPWSGFMMPNEASCWLRIAIFDYRWVMVENDEQVLITSNDCGDVNCFLYLLVLLLLLPHTSIWLWDPVFWLWTNPITSHWSNNRGIFTALHGCWLVGGPSSPDQTNGFSRQKLSTRLGSTDFKDTAGHHHCEAHVAYKPWLTND